MGRGGGEAEDSRCDALEEEKRDEVRDRGRSGRDEGEGKGRGQVVESRGY